jgi:hypothetical protein
MVSLQFTPEEFLVLQEALAQYVENERCRNDVDDPHAANKLLAPAEATLESVNMITAGLCNDVAGG